MTYYYKVTDANNLSVSMYAPKTCLEYKIGKWVKPIIKGSKIFIFKDLADAKNFRSGGNKIYKCLAIKPKKLKRRMDVYSLGYLYEDFWKCVNSKKRVDDWVETPTGTYGADRIKLVSQVKI